MTDPHIRYAAHHWILLAVSAFLPAVIVVGVVLYVALRDRRAGRSPATTQAVDRREDAAPPAPGSKPDSSNQRTNATDDSGD